MPEWDARARAHRHFQQNKGVFSRASGLLLLTECSLRFHFTPQKLIALIRPARTIGMFARLDRDEFRPNDNMTAFRIAQDRKCVPVIRHVDTVTTLGSKTYYCLSDRTMCRPMLLLFETKLARREARFRHFRELCRASHSCLARPSHPKPHGTGT